MRTLNLGILAHVDAGKTTLTERLLHAAGVINEIGRVDDGSTQTDSLALEKQRGITIKSAVVSFVIDGVAINLIDTPGHPDFIAEVERVLGVLDGAVLVVSAVEGVQPQTVVLMRTLRRLSIPALNFVNKIDRKGARYDRVLSGISARLTPAIVAMGAVKELGTRSPSFRPYGAADGGFASRLVDVLSERDDALLAAYVDDEGAISYRRLGRELAAQSGRALVHPVFFGSAITGAGVGALIDGITELLPAAEGDIEDPISGTVFKVERGAAGEKIAFVCMFSGTVKVRDRLRFGRDEEEKVTAISVFDRGSDNQRDSVAAGRIGKLWGLGEVRIGEGQPAQEHHYFAPPTLETVVVPSRPADKGAARRAHPACRAGPADRRAPGRPPPGALRLALWRGAEGGHLGDASRRLRTRRYVPRDDDLHRTTHRHRGGVRDHEREVQPVPRDRRVARRAGLGRLRRGVPARQRGAWDDAGRVLRGGRRDREGDVAPGAPRVEGHRLYGHLDPHRLRAAAEPLPPALQQEHVEHRRGLPWPDAAGADGDA